MHRKLCYPAVLILALCSTALADGKKAISSARTWYWGKEDTWAQHVDMLGKPMPTLALDQWIGPVASTKDKTLVLCFWDPSSEPNRQFVAINNEISGKYASKGVIVLGISAGGEGLEQAVAETKAAYANAVGSKDTIRDWRVMSYPAYYIADSKGTVVAANVRPQSVSTALDTLLDITEKKKKKDDEETEPAKIKKEWLEGTADQRKRLIDLEDQAPPELQVDQWINKPDDLQGKVVLIEFWAAWCGPCLATIPKNNSMLAKYGEKGLVIIGVCTPSGGQNMEKIAAERGLKYAVALDTEGRTIEAYKANGFPDYYLIDRFGKLRIADVANDRVEEAVEALLKEEP